MSRTGTTAVLNKTSHGFQLGDCIAISGVTNDTNWNGEYIITAATPDQLNFTVPDTLNASPSGTMIVKYPPISTYWSKVNSGTNRAIYKSTHPYSTGWFLRVDDSATRLSTVSMLEGFTTFTTGLVNRYDMSWIGSDVADSSTRRWFIVGDAFRFYFFTAWSTYSHLAFADSYEGNFFGDIIKTKSTDGYHCGIIGNVMTNAGLDSYSVAIYNVNPFFDASERRDG